eukprot:CAMPEP_0113942274 /NCGR_PEP_ID=MMETSP1339-20121228/8014_1 /TAXON_ID=94617 /ORGANISM="Fibrocapsa japonica" /LENGTH=224 /DNA_ID=CAMNT_0000946669 /DNA_START=1 /DNA_END=678 /DNA_ORIENTATION=+ /assembly_acc=CAM_ASM_000762
MNVKITEVYLPHELQQRLERTTAFRTQLEEAEKSHENKLIVLRDNATQELEVIRKTNARKLQELNAEIQRHHVEVEEMLEAAKGKAQVEETNVRSQQEVELTQARGDVEVAKVNAQQQAEDRIRLMEIECNKKKVKTDQEAQNKILASEAKLEACRNEAQALRAKAEAEAKAATQLEEKRRYEIEWERLGVLKEIAGKGRKFISGDKGDTILEQLTAAGEEARR